MKNEGVILKSFFPYRQKVALLDSSGHRFDAIVSSTKLASNLHHGYKISYTVSQRQNSIFLNDIEIISVPTIDFLQLKFIHQVFAICLYAMPCGQIQDEIFVLVDELGKFILQDLCNIKQKLFICRLLGLLGFYPDKYVADTNIYYEQIRQLMILPVDRLAQQKIDLETEQLLVRWVSSFILQCDSKSDAILVNLLR